MASLTRPDRAGAAVLLAVAVGGALGALLRHGVGAAFPVPGLGFPWPTLAVNVSGSAALAVVVALPAVQGRAVLQGLLGPGLLGGYTTFSAYAEESRLLLAGGRPGVAAGYLLATLACCLAGCLLGRLAGTALGTRLAGRPRVAP